MTSIPGVETSWHDRDAVVRLAKTVSEAPVVAEVGTWLGHTANFLADAGCLVWAVDTFTGTKDANDLTSQYTGTPAELYAAFRANVGRRLGNTIVGLWTDSVAGSRIFPDGVLDLVFLDADHRYEAVRADLAAWVPKVRAGGIVACHDYDTDQFPGVTQAVGELGVRVHKTGQCIGWFHTGGSTMPAETDKPTVPFLCDHEGCSAPAVGKFVVGRHGGFETVVRCQTHAGGAECKEKVNETGKVE